MAAFFKSLLFPSVKAQEEEEIVCPQATLRVRIISSFEGYVERKTIWKLIWFDFGSQESCGKLPKIIALREKFAECEARVNSKKETSETCAEELHDIMHALDHCVNKTLFSKLK